MHEEGIVVETAGRTAVVEIVPQAACGNCAARSCCAPLSTSRRRLEVENPVGARVGDRVSIAVAQRNYLTATALVYLLPIVDFIAGFVVGRLLLGRDIWGIVFGLAFFVSTFVLLKLIDRRARSLRPRATCIIGSRSGGPN